LTFTKENILTIELQGTRLSHSNVLTPSNLFPNLPPLQVIEAAKVWSCHLESHRSQWIHVL